jgi:hypothetical protein
MRAPRRAAPAPKRPTPEATRTSAKSTLTRPGTVMMSLMPRTPLRSTSSATRNASPSGSDGSTAAGRGWGWGGRGRGGRDGPRGGGICDGAGRLKGAAWPSGGGSQKAQRRRSLAPCRQRALRGVEAAWRRSNQKRPRPAPPSGAPPGRGRRTVQQAVVGDGDERVHRGLQVGQRAARLVQALAALKRERHGDDAAAGGVGTGAATFRAGGPDRVVGSSTCGRAAGSEAAKRPSAASSRARRPAAHARAARPLWRRRTRR